MIDKTVAYINKHADANVERLKELLRIPGISTDPTHKADIRTSAEWVLRVFSGCGIDAELVETAGHPCVIADTGPVDGGGPTVLVYGHYDVQPTGDESLWDSPAFEPTVRDGKIFARGAADDKGQALTHLLAAEAWMKTAGKTPIRVKFLIEGEEEIGSPNLGAIVEKFKDRLACHYVALSDTPKLNERTPAITYGTKGMVYKEIVVTGPSQNLHSGSFGGVITNPGNALARILDSLRDSDNRVTIPGFYDNVHAITDEETRRMDDVGFDERAFLQSMGAPALTGEAGFSTIERRWCRPTLDVNGLFGGYVGEGASTVIPAKVMAKVSMRIVPDQDAATISAAFDKAVRAGTPEGVNVEILNHNMAPAYVCPLDSAGIAAAERALEAGYGARPAFIREGGSLPILAIFKEQLGADSLMLGFCMPDCNAHGPNEYFGIDDFHNGTKSAAHLLAELAR